MVAQTVRSPVSASETLRELGQVLEWDTFRICWVSARELTSDPLYQRPLLTYKVQSIAGNYVPEAIGVLIVSERPDGTKVLLDGQHRLAALKMVDQPRALCQVYRGLSLAQEALIYVRCNYAHAMPKANQVFKARLIAGDPVAVRIANIAREMELSLALVPPYSEHDIRAVRALERIFTQGGEDHLRRVLGVARHIWPNTPRAAQSNVLLGLHIFILREREAPTFDEEHLITRLSALPVASLMREANMLAETVGGQVRFHVARTILRAYNEGLRARKLPDMFAMKVKQPTEDVA